MNTAQLSEHEAQRFDRDGYLIRRGLIDRARTDDLVALIDRSLNPALAPVEFEADVHYPGSPESRTAPGGHTPRRLLHAFSRDAQFQAIGLDSAIAATLKTLMRTDALLLSQNHHNCVMTKHPGYSSVTSWHQDIRYWRFDRPELVSTWLALGPENAANGCLLVLPGSHRLEIDPGRFDAALFLRTDIPENEELLATAKTVELEAGDVLFFHSKTLHAAGQNTSDTIKRTLVYTYRSADNAPIPETRSAVYPDIPVG
ncbi:MAG: phytanoyl-CoA dioxygenase family protein [Gammaproteobacteria bacterium]|nr:phytanoyl-CoA dioxygenase family protein [Gammaproteobacteria bacterium]